MASPDIGGGMGGDREGTHYLCSTPLPGYLLQVSGAISCVRGKRLAGSSAQPQERQIEVGAAESGIEQRGSG